MKIAIYLLAWTALAALIGISIWASGHIGIADSIRDLLADPTDGNDPWLIATLFDAYFGFLWFWAWVAYKETSNAARLAWLVLILGLGNIAMAIYMLIQLWRLPPGAGPEALLLRRA